MTDVATQLRASVDAQRLVQDILDEANEVLKHGNDLFNSPTDKEAYYRTLLATARITAFLAELNRIVRYDDQ